MIERINQTSEVKYRLPIVKLDLGETGQCSSAIIGVMKQPSGEKICSLQAVIMALQQCGVSSDLCDSLSDDLNKWLTHILSSQVSESPSLKYLIHVTQIKKAKRVIVLPRVGNSSGDPSLYQPIDSVSAFMVRLLSPTL